MILAGLEYDPGDLAALRARLATAPDAGRLREIGIRQVVIAHDALEQAPPVLAELGVGDAVIVLDDATPKRRGDFDLDAALTGILSRAGIEPRRARLAPAAGGYVVANLDRVGWFRDRLLVEPTTAVLAVGSGTVVDVAKEACRLAEAADGHRRGLVIAPTANSVTAYGSSLAVLFHHGAKRSFPGRFPDAVLCDAPTLAAAPLALTRAGLADCCARFVAYGDWFLAYQLGFVEEYSETPLAMMGADLDQVYLAFARDMGHATPVGVELLTRQNLLAGLAQSVVNTSTPLSGLEHAISHLLDMAAPATGRQPASHGAQVGVATLVTAAAYEEWLATFNPDDQPRPIDRAAIEARVRQTFAAIDATGGLVDEVWREYTRKLDQWADPTTRRRYKRFAANWPEIRRELTRLVRPAAVVREILRRAGAPTRFEDLDPPIPRSEARFALKNAHFVRARFALSDVLDWQGTWTDEFIDRLLATVAD